MSNAGPNADQRFVDYYADRSSSDRTRHRFEQTRRVILGVRRQCDGSTEGLDVVDIGCGAGTQTLQWAEAGHRCTGIDISQPLVELARKRATQAGLGARFMVGSAAKLDIADASVDVVMLSELLEHVADWRPCVDEAVRILRPGGVLYLSTTNRLCPSQQEYSLPGYSWYPASLKRHCERLAVTTHGHWVQYASFPAVHWFSYYQLRKYLDARGVSSHDRFDVMQTEGSLLRRAVVGAIRASRLLRFAGHVLTPYTLVVGYRRAAAAMPAA